MVQVAKLAVVFVVLVLIQCMFVDAGWLRRRRTRYSCRNRRSIYEMSEMIEHGDQLTMNQNDNDTQVQTRSKTSKRGFAAAIPFIKLAFSVLGKALNALRSDRKIAVGIGNDTPYAWKAIGVHFRSGTSNNILPACLSAKKAAVYTARKTSGPVARGAVAALGYEIPDLKVTLAVLFSVPFDYNWYSNWWDVRVFPGKISINYDLYERMYYGNPYKGDNRYHRRYLGHGLHLTQGFMTSGGTAELMIKIK